jgi:hypothetical protein
MSGFGQRGLMDAKRSLGFTDTRLDYGQRPSRRVDLRSRVVASRFTAAAR